MSTYLSISDLSIKFGDLAVLNGVSFNVSRGERVGLIGPNGCGKTTLFNCISGFNLPSAGKITFKDEDITDLAAWRRAKLGLGRVFQNFGIFREMTVFENVLTAVESKNIASYLPWSAKTKTNKKEALEALAQFKLESKKNNKAGSLSGGQMRLLEIARSIAFGAEVFLLDEPTAGVSPKMKGEIEAALSSIQELGKTILIIEHDINFIQRLCDRILVLDAGQIVLDDTPDKVRTNPRLQEIYFGNTDR